MIRTERLLLRRWRESDRKPFAALNADPIVREYLQGPITRDASDAFIDRIEAFWEARGWGLWAVEVPDVAAFVGYVGLWPANYVTGNPMIEVGWRLARFSAGAMCQKPSARALKAKAASRPPHSKLFVFEYRHRCISSARAHDAAARMRRRTAHVKILDR